MLQALRRPTPGELGFAASVGALLAISPLTGSARLVPSLALGAFGAVAVFVARRRWPNPFAGARSGPTLARPSLAQLALLAAVALVFVPTLVWFYREYTESVWVNGHGIFIPFLLVLLVRSALRRDPSSAQESSAWGFAFLAASLALVIVDAGVQSRYLSAFGLVLALPGLSLLLLGARRTRSLAVPLALAIFMLPLPTTLERGLYLSENGALLAQPMLSLLGVPAEFHQTQLRVLDAGFSIGQNCSGFSALYGGVAFAMVLLATARSWRGRLLPLLALYPAIVLANALRMAGLVFLASQIGQGIVHTPIHGLSGIFVYAFSLGVLWLCADRAALREALA
jgi:exosortase